MIKKEKTCLIYFFKKINVKYKYVVMRNSNELPFDNFSNDIDILINKDDFLTFEKDMKHVFKSNGYDQLERSSFHGIECFTFYNINDDSPSSIKIDIFFNIEGGGVIYYKFKDIIGYRIKNDNDIYVFDSMTEGFLTAIKTIVSGGSLKKKYLMNFIKYKPSSKYKLFKICPSNTLKNHLQIVLKTEKNINKISRKKILLEVFCSNVQESLILSFLRIMKHFSVEIKRAFSKKYTFAFTTINKNSNINIIQLQKNSKLYLRSNSDRIIIIKKNSRLNMKYLSDFYRLINYLHEYFTKIIFLQRNCKIIFYLENPMPFSTFSLLNIISEHIYNEQFNDFSKKIIRNITTKI